MLAPIMKRALLLGLSTLFIAGCAPKPPANWAQGGSPLDIPHARWVRGDASVEIAGDGRILVNGEHQLTIDRAGRIVDLEARPVALIERDGRLIGPDDKPLGMAGVWTASLPGETQAWLSLLPSGEVIRYGEDGARTSMGAWVGNCMASAPAHQTCMIVSHLLGMKLKDERPYNPGYVPGMTPGMGGMGGVGVGVGLFH
jgi:hypothetical protein